VRLTPDGDPPPAAPGMPGNPVSLADPRMMRALAHPARIAIWQHLGLEGPATATQCAAVAGLSPSACSYHLRTLARYGFVEEDLLRSTDGRERPWRAKILAFTIPTGDAAPAVRDAARLLNASASAAAEELRDSYRDRESEYPADWQAALGTNYDVMHVTPEELDRLRRHIVELFGQYRQLSRDERPAGARRVLVTADFVPWFEPDAPALDGTEPDRTEPGPAAPELTCPPLLPPEKAMTVTEETPARGPGRLAAVWQSGPLSVPGFRLLTFGQFASTIGDYCYAVALPWLVLSGGGSAASLGIVLACYGIPRALLTVPGGWLADRFGPRLVMLSSDFARCALTAVFAVLAAAHVSSLAALVPVAALLGAFSALFLPASMTMMPSLIEPAGLTAANSVYTGFVQAGSMLGPVIGGVLVASTGPTTAFAVDAGSYLVSAVTLGFISASARPTAAGERAAVADPDLEAPDAAASAPGPDAPVPRSVWVLLRQSRILQIILAAGLAVLGLALGFDNVLSVTVIQRWAPPALLGRVWGLLLLCSAGSFPVSSFIAGQLTRHLGPTPVFPIAGGLLALAMAYGLTQREFRGFGTPDDFGTPAEEPSPTPA
jgi:hypothetical protein